MCDSVPNMMSQFRSLTNVKTVNYKLFFMFTLNGDICIYRRIQNLFTTIIFNNYYLSLEMVL